MSTATKSILALVVLALAMPALADGISEVEIDIPPNAQTATVTLPGGEIWLIIYIDLDGSGTFNDRRELLRAVLLQGQQR